MLVTTSAGDPTETSLIDKIFNATTVDYGDVAWPWLVTDNTTTDLERTATDVTATIWIVAK